MPRMDGNGSEVVWDVDGRENRARYVSARSGLAPTRALAGDDETTADDAYRLASQGTALVWDGDYHNAWQLLQAMARRIDRKRKATTNDEPLAAFNAYRQTQAQRSNLMGLLLVPLKNGHVPLRRAPDVSLAVTEALGPIDGA